MPSSSLTMARLKSQVVEERRGLELHADARLDGRGIGPHGQAVDGDLAGVGTPAALQHLEGGRRAGRVGTEDADPSPRRASKEMPSTATSSP
jgi:hypothetical protein